MGDYPYPSDYIAGTPDSPLPAWPMRAACEHLGGDLVGEGAVLQVRMCAREGGQHAAAAAWAGGAPALATRVAPLARASGHAESG